MTERYICIHGHFYQPPRENPWLEAIEVQDSAYPYHDWNERITAECYAPNAASRLLDGEGKVLDIISNYANMSFNFGPTVLSWMEKNRPEAYQNIIDADKLSRERFSGHGSAMAQAYNHMIMPLANARDKRTQVIWGIRDFQKRFGRDPEGMWLPETAVDTETLEILAEQGVKFSILAPHQAKAIKNRDEEKDEWRDVDGGKIDPTTAYLYRLPSGKEITLFFYDGPISQGIAFERVLSSGEAFAQRLLGAFSPEREWPQLIHIATDGETYGHHHRFGDMALAFCINYIESNNLATLINYGEFLEKHPPTHEVRIIENSSWSCIHGVERWRADCGCSTGRQGWNQKWRSHLREALDTLRDQLIPSYQHEASRFLKDPWSARDDYIEVILDRSRENVEAFLKSHAVRELEQGEKVKVLKLLELQRHTMLMFTSCGWFFDELSGIETVQVLKYAAKAMQRAEEIFSFSLEPQFIAELQQTPSNVFANGAEVYKKLVTPAKIDLTRVAVHYAISSVFEEYPEHMNLFDFTIMSDTYEKSKSGKFTLATGKALIQSDIVWDAQTKAFAVLHLGDHNINGGIRDFTGDEDFSAMWQDIRAAFERGDATEVIQLMDKHFGVNNYSLWHLFRDEQRRVIDKILESTHIGIEAAYRQIYELNSPVMNFLCSLNIPLPSSIFIAAEYIVNVDMRRIFEDADIDRVRLERLIQEAQKWSLKLDGAMIGYVASSWITSQLRRIERELENRSLLEKTAGILNLIEPLSIGLDLWKAQNLYFTLKGRLAGAKGRSRGKRIQSDPEWMGAFRKLGNYLHMEAQ